MKFSHITQMIWKQKLRSIILWVISINIFEVWGVKVSLLYLLLQWYLYRCFVRVYSFNYKIKLGLKLFFFKVGILIRIRVMIWNGILNTVLPKNTKYTGMPNKVYSIFPIFSVLQYIGYFWLKNKALYQFRV